MSDSNSFVSTISSISNPFCSDCNRLRITSDGYAYTCLFSNEGINLNPWLSLPINLHELENKIKSIWEAREDNYSEDRFKVLEKKLTKIKKFIHQCHILGDKKLFSINNNIIYS